MSEPVEPLPAGARVVACTCIVQGLHVAHAPGCPSQFPEPSTVEPGRALYPRAPRQEPRMPLNRLLHAAALTAQGGSIWVELSAGECDLLGVLCVSAQHQAPESSDTETLVRLHDAAVDPAAYWEERAATAEAPTAQDWRKQAEAHASRADRLARDLAAARADVDALLAQDEQMLAENYALAAERDALRADEASLELALRSILEDTPPYPDYIGVVTAQILDLMRGSNVLMATLCGAPGVSDEPCWCGGSMFVSDSEWRAYHSPKGCGQLLRSAFPESSAVEPDEAQ